MIPWGVTAEHVHLAIAFDTKVVVPDVANASHIAASAHAAKDSVGAVNALVDVSFDFLRLLQFKD